MNIINEAEELEIRKFTNNKSAYNAIKKILLSPVYNEGILKPGKEVGDPLKNFALNRASNAIQTNPGITDKMLGQDLRANTQACRLIELGFQQLDKYKDVEPPKKDESNPAR